MDEFLSRMAIRNTFVSSGDCRLWTSSEFSSRIPSGDTRYGAGYGPLQRFHQGDHHEIVSYGAGYGPLQRSHQGDHHEIVGLQSYHQGYRVLIDQ